LKQLKQQQINFNLRELSQERFKYDFILIIKMEDPIDQEKENLSKRNPKEVFKDHLHLCTKWDLEGDLAKNTAKDIVILTNFGVFHGHNGVRKVAKLLEKELPKGTFEYKTKLCHGNMCFLHWTGDSETTYIDDGADSYLIENGVIKVQTIYYTVKKKNTQKQNANKKVS